MNEWQIAENRKPKGRPTGRPYVSLNRRGEFVINPAAWSWLGEVANVTLLYDSERALIGIKFPVAVDRHFFRVCRYGRGKRQRIVRALRMVRQFRIHVDQTIVFRDIERSFYNHEHILILDLKTAGTIDKRRTRS